MNQDQLTSILIALQEAESFIQADTNPALDEIRELHAKTLEAGLLKYKELTGREFVKP